MANNNNEEENRLKKFLIGILTRGLKRKIIIIGIIILAIISISNMELWDDEDDGIISRIIKIRFI